MFGIGYINLRNMHSIQSKQTEHDLSFKTTYYLAAYKMLNNLELKRSKTIY